MCIGGGGGGREGVGSHFVCKKKKIAWRPCVGVEDRCSPRIDLRSAPCPLLDQVSGQSNTAGTFQMLKNTFTRIGRHSVQGVAISYNINSVQLRPPRPWSRAPVFIYVPCGSRTGKSTTSRYTGWRNANTYCHAETVPWGLTVLLFASAPLVPVQGPCPCG